MYLAQLSLVEFRSYAAADVALEPGITVFAGPNGHGKTNLLEAIGYLASQDSHRVATDAPLVRAGASQAVVRGEIVRDGRRLLVELEINPGRANRARINQSALPRAREAIGALRSVLFAPEDIALVKGDPSDRRRYLDELLMARSPRFACTSGRAMVPLRSAMRRTRPVRNCNFAHERMCAWVLPRTCAEVTPNWPAVSSRFL